MEATGVWMFGSGSPGERQEQRAAQETNRTERIVSSSSTPPQKKQGREAVRYLLEQRIHTGASRERLRYLLKGWRKVVKGKGFSVSGQDSGKSD